MRAISTLFCLLACCNGWAITASEYLPEDADLDPAVPAPETVLGWEIGDWRISHDQLVHYMRALAGASDRVSLREIGHTHEQRPLLQLIITSPANQARVDELRQRHLAAANGGNTDGAPLVVWLGHSIHGNEASGSNAAPLVAYYLAASRSEFVTGLLDGSVILLDPSFNPDGLQRFAAWSNSNRSLNPLGDRNHRIHNEAWPENRTNHYLFDLNRDWLPLVHPESRARVAEFHRWLPHVLTDQHETSGHDGYFFQPGVPSRQNPTTPGENLEMTAALAQYHAAAMDAAGRLYFTEDAYDDFYFGKGSSYPDINGSIGILFEQPRVNGPVKDTDYGPLRFSDAIGNQLRTSLSTLRGAWDNRARLLDYQRGFFATMRERAAAAGFRAWIIGDDGDPSRARALLEVMDRHRIVYEALAEDVRADGRTFRAGHAWVIPVRQRQFGMLQAMMESRTEFADETFYDVSAWTQPLAYNLPYAQLQRMPATRPAAPPAPAPRPARDAVAWIVPWGQLDAPALLQNLLAAGARVRAATKPFTAATTSGPVPFAGGALVIHAGIQDPAAKDRVFDLLSGAAARSLVVASATSGLTPEGPDLGASHFKAVKGVRPLLLAGRGATNYDAGEVWHLLDQRLGRPPTMVEMHRLGSVRLHDYTHLVMVDGRYDAIGDRQERRIVQWIRDGGILVTANRAAAWAGKLCFENDCTADEPETDDEIPEPRAYGDFDDDNAQQVIGGAIVAATLDLTHPLAFGFQRGDLPLFRRWTTLLEASENAYAAPVRYTDEPLLSGFIGPGRLDEIRGQPAVIAERRGRGLVVRFANNPLFRGFWRGTERLFVNSLYFGQIVENTELPEQTGE